jgi:hypothetical protein
VYYAVNLGLPSEWSPVSKRSERSIPYEQDAWSLAKKEHTLSDVLFSNLFYYFFIIE